jgi:hypothetical protein
MTLSLQQALQLNALHIDPSSVSEMNNDFLTPHPEEWVFFNKTRFSSKSGDPGHSDIHAPSH